jgi:hypothetical protein
MKLKVNLTGRTFGRLTEQELKEVCVVDPELLSRINDAS